MDIECPRFDWSPKWVRNWIAVNVFMRGFYLVAPPELSTWISASILEANNRRPYKTERKIARYITARMKTVSPSLSAAQALDDLRMAVESGDYEATQ